MPVVVKQSDCPFYNDKYGAIRQYERPGDRETCLNCQLAECVLMFGYHFNTKEEWQYARHKVD